ncbi:MFS transporter [Actinacidiphila acidipaludis]|uniref:MFS transporter n=1 Tax=Actinacidiphila acidipaludis TaxID=2873382 RepID=A0ABS7Q550_9ACTN|nr:MFS transporter [Streptomyces acidipaludis]MBY8878285.1 MFS transporter [Streptomyces acidipaludis]
MTSDDSSTTATRLPSWANRDFQLLVSASFISGLGNSGATIAAAYAVIDTGGSATDVGVVAAARTLAMVVFLLIGGAVADRIPRQRVMVSANTVNALSQGLFALLVLAGHPPLWQMAALTAVGGTAQAFFSPASQGLVMSTVEPAHAGKAFSVFRLATNGANIGGAAIGGALIAALGPGWVLAVDAIGFAVAGGLRARLSVREAARVEKSGMIRDLREGWREFVSRSWLWGIVVQFAVVNAMTSAAQSVYGPLVSRDHLGGAGPWGLALAADGVGTVLGGLLMIRWKPRRILLSGTLGVFPLALPLVALALALPLWALVAAELTAGVAIEVFGVGWMVALHQEIPEDKMSRVSAYDWLGSIAVMPLGLALAGPAATAFGRTQSLWGSAVLVVVLTAAVLVLPDVRRLERGHGVAVPEPAADATGTALPAAPREGTAAGLPQAPAPLTPQ